MRARFLRPVSALSRLDLPTLERPESAISVPRIGGSETAEPAAAAKPHSPANRCRPASISSRVNLAVVAIDLFLGHSGAREARTRNPDAGTILVSGFQIGRAHV